VGLLPRNSSLAIVRPIPLYGNIVWWDPSQDPKKRRAPHQWGAPHHRHWITKHNSRPSTPGPTCQKLGISSSAEAPRSSGMDNRLSGSLQYPNKWDIHTTYYRLRSTHSQLQKKIQDLHTYPYRLGQPTTPIRNRRQNLHKRLQD